MLHHPDLAGLGLVRWCAIAAAFAACFATVVFSWPDRHDRKRAVFPHPLRCCEIRIAHWVVVPGARAERERLRTAPAQTFERKASLAQSEGAAHEMRSSLPPQYR
jgi:hypothetical protein